MPAAPKPKNPPLTHFLCIPLVTASSAPQWHASLDRFSLDATGEGGSAAGSASTSTSTSTSTPVVHGGGDSATVGKDAPQNRAVPAPTRRGAGDRLPEKAIRPLHSLHLTLGVMSLREPGKLEEAKKVLGELNVGGMLRGNTTHSGPLHLTMKSLHPMQSPKSTSVLYTAPHEPTGRLLPFCQSLRHAFAEINLILDENRDLKLHATIVNTLHARPKGGKLKKKKPLPAGWGRAEKKTPPPSEALATATAQAADPADGQRAAEGNEAGGMESREDGTGSAAEAGEKRGDQDRGLGMDSRGKIDGRWLIEKWKDEVWAEVTVEKVAICEMGAKADESGIVRYKEVAEVGLPG